ncbi:MbtH family protein [Kitasatospora sp. NPDC004799]|uniref:MbtH family protein n=1 Tax=Kitasatospora sp. NPDC004799 TaxID=3154460 RepID=UPI0033AB840C
MTSPFDDPDAAYLVLVNPRGQYSLWPAFAQVPPGWRVAFGQGARDECLAFVDRTWTDQRPPAGAPVTATNGKEVAAP